MRLRTCVTPQGVFRYGIHQPSYTVDNLRQQDDRLCLGRLPDGSEVWNQINYPQGDVCVEQASTVYEIPNAFPFRGCTFIDACWAGRRAGNPASIRIAPLEEVSMAERLSDWARQENVSEGAAERLLHSLPSPVLLALATTTRDSRDLVQLARMACDFDTLPGNGMAGQLAYRLDACDQPVPVIHDCDLFEAVANNPNLPDEYKEAMLLRPGVQGGSEVVGDYEDRSAGSHIFEYLRRNSYIPWGHYATNMAHDAVRYSIRDLSADDMRGLRHLYYQRVLVRLAGQLGLEPPKRALSEAELEDLRQRACSSILDGQQPLQLDCCLWGWNFGFDFAPTRYKLHGSHQQIHQQNAMIPAEVRVVENGLEADSRMPGFACGDMVAEVVEAYRRETGQEFFEDLIRCLRSNRRTDSGDGDHSLIVHEDENVVLFVPKAQVSQWELQLMPLGPVGNILEADAACRRSLDRAMLLALRLLEGLGASMVTSIEFSKRFSSPESSQRLLYSFLPKLPWSPGSFSEAQYRFICSHYPEDFAAACRAQLKTVCPEGGGS